jgi:hypothetical protein
MILPGDRVTGAVAGYDAGNLHLAPEAFPSTLVQWTRDGATYVLDLTAIG